MKSDDYEDSSNETSSEEEEITEVPFYDKTSIRNDIIHEMEEQVSELPLFDHKEEVDQKKAVDFNCKENFHGNYECFGKLEAISIKTDFTCSVDNQKSPQ